jgi:hypothetical protein
LHRTICRGHISSDWHQWGNVPIQRQGIMPIGWFWSGVWLIWCSLNVFPVEFDHSTAFGAFPYQCFESIALGRKHDREQCAIASLGWCGGVGIPIAFGK